MKRAQLDSTSKAQIVVPVDLKYSSDFNYAASDAAILNAAAANVATGGTLVLEPTRVYVIDDPVDFGHVGEIIGNNATIKPSLSLIKSGVNSCITWNKALTQSNLGTPISVTAGSKTVQLPANFDVAAGDMLYFRGKLDGSENWVTDPNPGGTSHYFHGMYATVQSVSGSLAAGYTVKLSSTFYASFTVATLFRFQGLAQQRVSNLNIDMSNTDETCTKYIEGFSVYGANIDLSGVKAFGNEYGIIGGSIAGQNGIVSNSSFQKFLCIQGQDNGAGSITGRTGYGLLNNCNNSVIDQCGFSDCKHHISSGSHYSVSDGMVVSNSNFAEDETLPYTSATGALYEGVIDSHCGMKGRVIVEKCKITAYNKVMALRTKTALIKDTKIKILSAAGTSVIAGFEQDFDGIIFNNTDIEFPEGSSQAVLAISGTGGVPGVTTGQVNDFVQNMRSVAFVNCRVSGVNGSGYLLSITRPTAFTVDGFTAINTECTDMKAAINLNPGTSSQCSMAVRNLSLDLRMSGCEQIVNLYVETPAANPATDQYYFRNWDLSGVKFTNPRSSTLHPVSLSSPVESRNVEIKNFLAPSLVDLTGALNAASTAYCMSLQVSMTIAKLQGVYTRGAGASQARGVILAKGNFTDVDCTGLLSDGDLGVLGSGSVTFPTKLTRCNFGGVNVRDLKFEETTADVWYINSSARDVKANSVRFVCRAGSTGWANSTEFALDGATMTTNTGFALQIDANSTGHKVKRTNITGLLRGQVDQSGTYYGKPIGNTNPVRTYGVGTWAKGAVTTFNVPSVNTGTNGGTNPYLTVGQLITIAGVTGAGAGDVNGKTVPIINISGVTVTVPIDTSATSTLNSSGNITTTSSVDWKAGTQAEPDGRLLSVGAPTSGTWNRADRVDYANVAAGGPPGAVCTEGGTPGTWKALASIAA